MSYRRYGSALGRSVFVKDEAEANELAAPDGYSIAGVVLEQGWTSGDLGWLLNQLYGALDDWTEFRSAAGARSFVFYGERAEEASNLCDTFAYAWTRGVEREYDDVIASSNDAPDLDAFVESLFTGEVAAGESYASGLQNLIFAVLGGGTAAEESEALRRLGDAVDGAMRRHHFD